MSLSFRDAPIASCVRAAAAVAVVTAASPLFAQEIRLEVDPAVLLSDNPFLLPGGEGAIAAELVVRPTVTWTTSPGTRLELRGAIADRQYTRRYGNFLTGRAEFEGSRRESEFLSYDASVSFARELSSDVLTSAIDAVVDPRAIRQSYGARSSLTWNFDANTSLRPSIGWERADFSRSTLLEPSETFDANLVLNKRIDALTTIGVRTGAVFGSVGIASDLSTQVLLGTVERRLNSAWRATGELGVERASSRTEAWMGVPGGQDARTRLTGRGSFCYEPSRLEACVAGALQSEVSSLGGLQRNLFFSGLLRRQWSEQVRVGLDVEYRRATVQDDGIRPLDALRLSGSIDRTLTQRLTLRAVVEYLRRQLLTGERIGAGFLQLRLLYRWGRL